MQKNFLTPDNKLLYKKAKVVKKEDFKSQWFLDLLNKMKEVAGANQNHGAKNKPVMLGLAATQIGVPYKIVFVDLSATPQRDKREAKNIFLINPKIVFKSEKQIKNREGCYSTMLDTFRVNGVVERSDKVSVKYFDENGVAQRQDFSGFTAVIVQHELDHLEGKVFVHRIKNEKDLHVVFNSEWDSYKETYKKWKRTIKPEVYFKDICKINS